MSDLLQSLRGEIRRLAKKEIRGQVEAVKRVNARLRRDVAALKRQLAELEKRAGFLESQERKRLSSAKLPADDAEKHRFSPRSVRAHRRKLGLSAQDYGLLVGVSGQTIYHWEQGKSRPRKSQLAALVSIRPLGKREAAERLKLLSSHANGPAAGTTAE
jgi:DNA-binding transcriptional regulator YiaG